MVSSVSLLLTSRDHLRIDGNISRVHSIQHQLQRSHQVLLATSSSEPVLAPALASRATQRQVSAHNVDVVACATCQRTCSRVRLRHELRALLLKLLQLVEVEVVEHVLQLVVLRADLRVEVAHVVLVTRELRRQVQVLVLEFVEQDLHVELLQQLVALVRCTINTQMSLHLSNMETPSNVFVPYR